MELFQFAYGFASEFGVPRWGPQNLLLGLQEAFLPPPSLRFAHLDNINYPPDLSPSHDYDKTCLSLQYRVNFRRQNSLCFFFKKYLSLTLTGFCVLKRVGY